MRTECLRARVPQAFMCTTNSRHADPIAPNPLARRFAMTYHPVSNRAWAGDMTDVPTRCDCLYLAVLIDRATRMVVGCATSTSMATALPLRALQHAITRRQPAPGLIEHTHRGSQYASAAQLMRRSMSRKGDCWDNAVTERFFATREHELLAHTVLHSHHEANVALTDFNFDTKGHHGAFDRGFRPHESRLVSCPEI
jgi:putative transposase